MRTLSKKGARFHNLIFKLIILHVLVLVVGCQPEDEFYEKIDSPARLLREGGDRDLLPTDPTPVPTPPPGATPIPTPTPDPTPTPNPNMVTDNFLQDSQVSNAKFDIVWVVDNSGSMEDQQDALSQNFSAFIDDFLDKNLDFQMAITTTDPNSGIAGEFVAGSTNLNSTYAQANEVGFKADFENMIRVGTTGSGNEQGLYTALEALTRADNNSFYRDEAILIYVIVSDEEEHSSPSVQSYIDSMLAEKGSLARLKIYSIVETDTATLNNWEELGTRYIEASQLSGGQSMDIDEDFFDILSGLSGTLVELSESFSLTELADEATIEVYIDGVQTLNGWSYNPSNNSVTFDQGSIPADGSQVVISYYRR